VSGVVRDGNPHRAQTAGTANAPPGNAVDIMQGPTLGGFLRLLASHRIMHVGPSRMIRRETSDDAAVPGKNRLPPDHVIHGFGEFK
jgi:hypothetical protein